MTDLKLLHNSRQALYRNPLGAVENNSVVTLRLAAQGVPEESVCLVCSNMEGLSHIGIMQYDADLQLFTYDLQIPNQTGLLYYYFILNNTRKLMYYGGTSGKGFTCEQEPYWKFCITVYEQNFSTPRWFRDSIMYQIFVDRFARGTPRGGLDRIQEPASKGQKLYLHEDWNEQPIHWALPGERHYDPCDYFGGDLEGVIQKLPYLASMGVQCIYFNPIFEAHSNHKYNTGNYRRVDPMFGDNETFARLCECAKTHQIQIMLDGVFSHTGDDSLYFNRYGHYDEIGAYQGAQSQYFNWYSFSSFPQSYASWWGFDTLPEVNEMNDSFLQFVAIDEDSVLKYWLKLGAKAWRLDVADELPDEFIRILRRELKKHDPDAVLLGEVWEDPSTKFSMGEQREYVMGQELDSTMNYPFSNVVINFLLGKMDSITACELLMRLQENQPEQFYYANMNLLSSHDVPRALSLLGGAPGKDSGLSREGQARFRLSQEQYELGVLRMKLAICWQMVMPGVPCIYYGDEVGMTGLMDPFNRQTYPWGKEDARLLEWTRFCTALRKQHPVLVGGKVVFSHLTKDIFVIVRFDQTNIIVVVLNRSNTVRQAWVDFTDLTEGVHAHLLPQGDGDYEDLCTQKVCNCKNNILICNVAKHSQAILRRKL